MADKIKAMEIIGINGTLINKLSGALSLNSSKIDKIDIYTVGNSLLIDVSLNLMYAKNAKNIKLAFSGIFAYSFFYSADYYFYNIEIYKFLMVDNRIYISFDPVDESENISDGDQDYILSENVEGYFVNKDIG